MIAKSWLSRCWQWQIGGCVAIVRVLCVGVSDCVKAQIVPDNTLGAESSVVIPDVINGIQGDRIEGGATREANLFHSFSQFNVGAGRGAYFTNPPEIENILSRVTGANRSDILGRLGVDGDANLFLINPNGIVFGSDASLDVQGSFVATTANAIQFPNGEVFSASTPSAPSSLLIVNPSAFFFNQVPAGAISNSSRTPVGTTPLGDQFGLRVPDGQSLLLVGGDIVMDGGGAIARDGRIELGAIAGLGTVGLNVDGNDLSLSFPDGADRADIALSNGALVSVNGEGGGDIQIEGRRITLSRGSQMTAVTLGAETGGTLAVTASESVEVIGTSADGQFSSGLSTESSGSGEAGDLTIDTSRLLVRDGAEVSASTFGEGKGGSINITTGTMSASGAATLTAHTFGRGNAGNVTITATDSVSLEGSSTGIGSQVFEDAVGNGGSISITTGTMSASNGATLVANTSGQGNAGDVTITATDSVSLDGSSTGIGSQVFENAVGNGGSISITTGTMSASNGATLVANTSGLGNVGDVTIRAADSVSLDGMGKDTQVTGIGSQVLPKGVGDGGSIDITTATMSLSGGALVLTSTSGEGNGGSLQITASDSVEVIGTRTNGQYGSGLFTQSDRSGNAGDLTIDTGRLLVRDGGQIVALTEGASSGGNLNINASESVEVIGTTIDGLLSQIIAASGSISRSDTGQLEIEIVGPGGNLTIYTGELTVKDGAQVSVNSNTSGNAGNLVVGAGSIFLNNEGKLTANSDAAQGGNITLQVKDLLLARHNSEISAQSFGTNSVDGNINIDARAIIAIPSENSDIIARSTNRGNIDITAKGLFGFEFREQLTPESDITATGRITSNLPDTDISQELAQLPSEILDTDSLLANSCIVRRNQPTRGSLTITGTGGLPQRPGDAQKSSYPTVDIETLPSDSTPTNTNPNRPWQKGDPIVEPQGVYRLPNGKLVLSRECPDTIPG